MNFISTTNWGFDTDLSMKQCIPELKVLKEWELIDKIFDWDLFLEKLIGIDWNNNDKLLQKYDDRCENHYEEIQYDYSQHLREMWYSSIEWVMDWYEDFCRDSYGEVCPVGHWPLFPKVK